MKIISSIVSLKEKYVAEQISKKKLSVNQQEDIEVIEKRAAIIEKNLPVELHNDLENPNNIEKVKDLVKITDPNHEYRVFELGYAFIGFGLIDYAKCCYEALQAHNPEGKFTKSMQRKIETFKVL